MFLKEREGFPCAVGGEVGLTFERVGKRFQPFGVGMNLQEAQERLRVAAGEVVEPSRDRFHQDIARKAFDDPTELEVAIAIRPLGMVAKGREHRVGRLGLGLLLLKARVAFHTAS